MHSQLFDEIMVGPESSFIYTYRLTDLLCAWCASQGHQEMVCIPTDVFYLLNSPNIRVSP